MAMQTSSHLIIVAQLRRIVLAAVVLVVATSTTFAIPQFSALSGNRCSNCHVAPHGGGLRSETGWYSYYDVGLISRENAAVKWLYDLDESNSYLGGMLTAGMDFRIQNTRSFSSDAAKRVTFPMQASLYAALTPISGVTLEGSFNLAALRTSASGSKVAYPGQRDGHFSAIIKPDNAWPSLRLGLFRPGVGVRYDDHTVFPGSLMTSIGRQPLLAPNWAEYGAELNYEGLKWLTLTAGVFGTGALSQLQVPTGSGVVQALANDESPLLVAKAVLWPRMFNDMLNVYVGGSVLATEGYSMVNTFMGAGITDNLSLTADLLLMKTDDIVSTRSGMVELTYQVTPEILPFVRWEGASTTFDALKANGADDDVVYAGVFGAHVFVLPYVVLRPEYRMWDTRLPGTTSRWNFQLYVFY
ncbi:MAG: hypothetical protein FGM24_02415 [Candidatus Kapabacteria bacterium]|nr:hypothetical protein [Candidatus Kapabacteria bacterium]